MLIFYYHFVEFADPSGARTQTEGTENAECAEDMLRHEILGKYC